MTTQRPNAQLFAGISPKAARKLGKYKGSWFMGKTPHYRKNPGAFDTIKALRTSMGALQEAIEFAEKEPEIAVARKCVRRARRFQSSLMVVRGDE
jgi:hypothetical protein